MKIQKEGLRVHPHSEETKQLWKSIQSTCNVSGNGNESILAVNAVDDSLFDQTSSSFKQVDSVSITEYYISFSIGFIAGKVLLYRAMCSFDQEGAVSEWIMSYPTKWNGKCFNPPKCPGSKSCFARKYFPSSNDQ